MVPVLSAKSPAEVRAIAAPVPLDGRPDGAARDVRVRQLGSIATRLLRPRNGAGRAYAVP